jgi:hypothetical protein
MHQGVADAPNGLLEPVVGPDRLAPGQERCLDQVDEAAADHFRVRAVGPATDQRTAFALQKPTAVSHEPVAVRHPHGHVEPAVGAERQAVQAAVVGVPEAGEDHGAAVGAAVAIGVLQGD